MGGPTEIAISESMLCRLIIFYSFLRPNKSKQIPHNTSLKYFYFTRNCLRGIILDITLENLLRKVT